MKNESSAAPIGDPAPGPADTYSQSMAVGHRRRREGRYVEAAVAFTDAELNRPGDRDALLLLATCLKQAKKYDEAIDAFRLLLDKNPNFAQGWSLFGVLLKNLDRFPEAITALETSLRLQDDVDTRNTLVVSLYRANRHDKALDEGQRNLELKDRNVVAAFKADPAWQLRASRCSDAAKNVISFSLWGTDPIYINGAIVNARIAPHIYYGWTTRFYCDSSVPEAAVVELKKAGAQIVWMRDPALQAIRPMWRFLASDDPDVDRFICRDADSRLNCQELLAVDEWCRSDKNFHVMRDHIYHMELMLAGMWGGKAGVLPKLRERLLTDRRYFDNRFADQAFLMNEIWPLIRGDVLSHDSYYSLNGSRPFPGEYRLPRPVHVGGAVKAAVRI